MKSKLLSLTMLTFACGASFVSAQNAIFPFGNVGIGTLYPTSPLTIRDAADPSIELNNGTHFILMSKLPGAWNGLTSPFVLQADTSGDMVMTPALNSPRSGIVIKQNGNVGIGTETPEAKLDIRGAALFRNGNSYKGTIVNVQANQANEMGGGMAVGNAGGLFSFNDGFVTYKNLDGGGGLKVDADFTMTGANSIMQIKNSSGFVLMSKVSGRWSDLNNPFVIQANTSGDMVMTPALNNPLVGIVLKEDGSVGIGTAAPAAKLEVVGQIRATTLLLTSDRNAKAAFRSMDSHDVLKKLASLPITTWDYTNAPGVRHLGPMAQDFKAAFNLGEDDKHIATVDADGVALASIQALYEIVQEKDSSIAILERQVSELKTELAGVKTGLAERLAALETAMSKDVQTSFRPEAAR